VRLSSILRLYRVRLRARLTQELFAVLGIAIGVSLLFASQVANTSLNGSVQQLTTGLVGSMRFQLAARDAAGFDERLLSEVERLRGVQAAAPVLEQDANVVGPRGSQSVDLVGTDPRLARLGGTIARHVNLIGINGARVFTLPAPVAERIGATSLGPVELQLGAGTTRALLVPDLLARSGALRDSPIALAPLRTVQRLARLPGRLTSIYVRSPPRLDASVRAELERLAGGRLNVRPADFATTLFRRAAEPVDQSTSLFSALSALVGFLFAFNALLLTVPQRRSLIHDLRLDGYTRRMIVEVLLLDALVLGVIASVLGLLLGELLSRAVFSSNPGYLSFAFPVGAQRIVTAQSVALAVLGGMLAAGVGMLMPLRTEILRRPAGTRMAGTPDSRARVVALLCAALLCVLATTAILLLVPSSAIVGVLTLTCALLLCMPAVVGLSVRALGRLQSMHAAASSYLALIELRSPTNRSRSLAIAATGAIAVFGTVSIEGARANLQRGLDASARAIDSVGDVWITFAGTSNSFATTPFADFPRSTAALSRLAGVRAVELYRGSFLDWRDRRVWVLGPPLGAAHPIDESQLVQGTVALTTRRLHEHGWVVISRSIASEDGLHVGQSFTLPSPHPERFRVAALATNMGWSPGAIVMNADDYARAWGRDDPSAYLLQLAPGASPARVVRAARLALGPTSPLHVEARAERDAMHFAQAAQGLSRLSQIRSLVLIAAVLAMAAAMGAMIWQRRVRLADMKVDGFGRLLLWRSLLLESLILLGVGCALGAVFGLYGQLLLGRALSTVNGFPVIETLPFLGALGSFALITAVAVGIVAVPGYLAARVRPTIALPE
jgi:putative ABC transport system permease protein